MIRGKGADVNDGREGEGEAYRNGDETHTFLNGRVQQTDVGFFEKATDVGRTVIHVYIYKSYLNDNPIYGQVKSSMADDYRSYGREDFIDARKTVRIEGSRRLERLSKGLSGAPNMKVHDVVVSGRGRVGTDAGARGKDEIGKRKSNDVGSE